MSELIARWLPLPAQEGYRLLSPTEKKMSRILLYIVQNTHSARRDRVGLSGLPGLCFRSITNTPAPFVSPKRVDAENARQFWLSRESSLSYASLPSPEVLYETLAHPSGIENIFARRMVLASGFRGSSLRLPLSGMVYCEIATRTLGKL